MSTTDGSPFFLNYMHVGEEIRANEKVFPHVTMTMVQTKAALMLIACFFLNKINNFGSNQMLQSLSATGNNVALKAFLTHRIGCSFVYLMTC